MKIDGRLMAQQHGEILAEHIASFPHRLVLRVFVLSKDAATEQFIRIKKRVGESVGVMIDVVELPVLTTTEELIEHIGVAVVETHGIIVQLPLPANIDFETVRQHIPASHDVDCLGVEAEALLNEGTHVVQPPVVAAFAHILKAHDVEIADKKVVVVGKGRLVGAPAVRWFEHNGARVDGVDKDTRDVSTLTQSADIIVLGAGAPHMLKPHMIQEGVIIFDAGTSESAGKVVGDADPSCEEKAQFITPVPGGVGPLAVMMIFENLYRLKLEAMS